MAKVCTGAPTESCCYRSSWQPTAALATSPTPALWPAAMHRSWRTSWVSRVLPPAWHPLGNPMSGSPLSCHSHQPGRTAIAALHGQLALRADPVSPHIGPVAHRPLRLRGPRYGSTYASTAVDSFSSKLARCFGQQQDTESVIYTAPRDMKYGLDRHCVRVGGTFDALPPWIWACSRSLTNTKDIRGNHEWAIASCLTLFPS